MLEKQELKMCKFLINIYKKRLSKYIKINTKLNSENICNEYIERFYKYINNVDMGNDRGKFTSYLNIFSGLCVYEILREKGLSEEQGISAYNEMCASMRKFSVFIYKVVDLLPNSYNIIINNLKSDLTGSKSICWNTKILKDDKEVFSYDISKCLYFDTCEEYGYPEFCKVFCTHEMNEYINLTLENIDNEHICCAIGDKKHQSGVDSKKEWIKSKLKDGHIFRKLNARGKIFIEYEPIETAWIPIT